jgi:hypothetical protein
MLFIFVSKQEVLKTELEVLVGKVENAKGIKHKTARFVQYHLNWWDCSWYMVSGRSMS